jgi:hypothetical protein
MIFRQLDVNHDWTFGKGIANYAQQDSAIALDVQTSLLSWVGDCFFDLQFGIAWARLLDTGQQANLQTALQSLILKSYGVVSVNSVSALFNPITRNLGVNFNIETIFSKSFQQQVSIVANTAGD